MTQLKNYQTHYIERLLDAFNDHLDSDENETIIFQAPTGSGKTIMVAELLKRFVQNRTDDKKFSFVWISLRKLHIQSKDKLFKYYENDKTLKCSYYNNLQNNRIAENEILFLNWESVRNEEKNLIVDEERENGKHLKATLNNTRNDGREIILIIDESHHSAKTAKALTLQETIDPKLTLEVSATPHLTEFAAWISVPINRVKAEHMIVWDIIVNPKSKIAKMIDKDTLTPSLIKQALHKRVELKKMFEKEKSDVNPLVLLQLPDRRAGNKNKEENVISILKDCGINEDDESLAIMTTEKKTPNLEKIEQNDDKTRVLIFKQAIAVGWDCPRATILLSFRESKSETFKKQVLGRILRTPEQKYYPNYPDLNNSYIFSDINEDEAQIKEDFAKDFVSLYTSKRKNSVYQKINLSSIFLPPRTERAVLSLDFLGIFNKHAKKEKLKNINKHPSKKIRKIISDGEISNMDKINTDIKHYSQKEYLEGPDEIAYEFDNYIVKKCTSFTPKESSHSLKSALYDFLKKNFNVDEFSTRAQKIILDEKNKLKISNVIKLSLVEYKKMHYKKQNQRIPVKNTAWEVPEFIQYTKRHEKKESEGSIMEPLYLGKPSKPEQKFLHSLKKAKESNKIKWWYKNGVKHPQYLAVLYQDKGVNSAFYPDWIVYYKNGSIGVFDTKDGITASDQECKDKAEALQKFIRLQNRNRRRNNQLKGGIVVEYKGDWHYNDKPKYHFDENEIPTVWKQLDIQF